MSTESLQRPPVDSVIRRVMIGQMLFSAGHALTTGGFLNYFAIPYFKGFAVAFAIMQITPEVAESLAVVTRWLVLRWGGRKSTWWVALLLGRVSAFMIPLLALCGLEPGSQSAIPIFIVVLGGWWLLQGVSYTAYLSWLSDLIPEVNWGQLLARRSIMTSITTLGMTYGAAEIIDRLKLMKDQSQLTGYSILFLVGGLICLASIIPLWRLPALPMRNVSEGGAQKSTSLWDATIPPLRQAMGDRVYRRFLLGCWQLSFFQGMTQTAQYLLSVKVLHVSLREYYRMQSVMLLLQIPLAALAGNLVDRGHDRKLLVGSLLALSLAMGCWGMATLAATGESGTIWLYVAYAIWGLFGMVNVVQSSLGMKLAPRSDNTVSLILFRQVGGLVAGLAGLIGGIVLDRFSVDGRLPCSEVFLGLFVISGLGRGATALWFLGREPSVRV